MESKKNKKVDEHKRSTLYLMIGLAMSASVSLMAFEWKSYGNPGLDDFNTGFSNHEQWDEVPPTVMPEPKPPVMQQPQIVEIEDDEDVIEEIDFIVDVDMNEETIIEEFIPDDEPDDPEPYTPFIVLEEEASFPGGNQAWGKFLNKHLKYPRQAKRMGIEGRVFLQFDVSAEGEISNIEVVRDIGGGCGEEAIRVLQKSPKWNPGLQRGRAVKSKHRMSFVFRLN